MPAFQCMARSAAAAPEGGLSLKAVAAASSALCAAMVATAAAARSRGCGEGRAAAIEGAARARMRWRRSAAAVARVWLCPGHSPLSIRFGVRVRNEPPELAPPHIPRDPSTPSTHPPP